MSACPGSGCCISERSIYDMVASVASGAVQLAALKERQKQADTAAAEDMAFFELAEQFAACAECCDPSSGCCHSVLETVQAIKGTSHMSAFSILSLATARIEADAAVQTELQRRVYGGLHDVSATQSRLTLRCELLELCMQVRHRILPPSSHSTVYL